MHWCYNTHPMENTPSSDPLFTDITFDEIDLPSELLSAIAELGWVRLTQVQAQVLPLVLERRDVVVQAQTGTGKTATYLAAIFTHALRHPRAAGDDSPRALIVAPTRELAVQVAKDAEDLGRYTGLSTHVVFGGLDYRRQRETLSRGTDLLIGTPGRLIDYHRQGAYSLHKTGMVVIDECDRLFDMGFADDIRWILNRLPHPRDRHSMMFTATLSPRVQILGTREMNNAAEILITPERLTPEAIRQELYHVASHEKLSLLLGLLEREGCERTMIFVNTRVMARRLEEDLQRHGYHARGLSGNVMQRTRMRVLDEFRDGTLPILVATDVASRGLHIEGVSHIINYDLPQDAEDYVHRIGRTARAGADGVAISLACDNFVYSLDAIQKLMDFDIPVAFAENDLYKRVKPCRPVRRDGDDRGQRPRRSRSDGPSSSGEGPREPRPADGDEGGGSTSPSRSKKRRRRRRPRRPDDGGAKPSDGGEG